MNAEKLLAMGLEAGRRAVEVMGARSRFVDVASLRMHCFEVPGKKPRGPTVVVLHGLGGSSLGFLRVMFPLAKGVGRVVVPDLPGSGFSPLPPGGAPGFAEVMDVFEKWADVVVPEKAIYVGNSLGGAMIARFAARRPEKVLGTVLVAPAGGRVEPERLREMIDSYQVRTPREAREMAGRYFSHTPKLLPYLVGPTLLPMMSRPSVRKLLEDAIRESALAESELSGQKAPVLLLWAGNERVLPLEGLEHFRKHLPATAQIEVVEDFGHSPQLDRPKQLVKRLLRFADERAGDCNP